MRVAGCWGSSSPHYSILITVLQEEAELLSKELRLLSLFSQRIVSSTEKVLPGLADVPTEFLPQRTTRSSRQGVTT